MTSGVDRAAQEPRRHGVAHRHGDEIEAQQPGDQIGAADQQRGAQAALDHDRGQGRHGVGGGLAARRAQHVLDREVGAAERDRQQQQDDADVEGRRRAGEQQQPEHHEVERDQPGAEPMASARRLAALPRRVAPDDVQAEPDQHHAAHQPDQVARRPADPEQRQHVERDPHEREPADEDGRPDEPEAGGRGRHRDDAEALGAGRQQDPAEHQDQPDDQEGQEIGEHDLLEQRWPVEQEEAADAAQREGEHHAEAVGEASPDRAQALLRALEAGCDHALTEPGRRPPEQPFEAEAEAGEDGQQQDHLGALPGLGEEGGPGPGELVVQGRRRGRELMQERADVLQLKSHELVGARGAAFRRRRRCAGRRRFGLGLQPGLDRRVAQQLGQRAQLLGAGLGRLGRRGPGGQQSCEDHEEKQHPAHVG